MDLMDQNMILTPALSDYPDFKSCIIPPRQWGDGLLIRTPNWLGDAVMTFPALVMLKKILPEHCTLFIACPKSLAPLFDEMQEVGRVIPLEDAHAFPNASERETLREICSGGVLLFNNSFRDALALKMLGKKNLFGVSIRNRGILLRSRWHLPKRKSKELNPYHQACVYQAMAKALGAADWDGAMPVFSFREKEKMKNDPRYTVLLEQPGKLLTIAPGAAYGDAKRWDSENFRTVADWWIREKQGVVAVIGTSKELEIARQVTDGLPAEKSFLLAGKTSLKELMIILQASACCLANDSGTMHLAASLGTAGVAVFGSTDPVATCPVVPRNNWRMVYRKISCSPCFKRECPYHTKECFAAVTPELVQGAVEQVLDRDK